MLKPDRLYDKTQLHIDTAADRGIIHRDYAAHYFRWSAVMRFLGERSLYKTARILDIGCGQDFPLAKTMYANRFTGSHYVGVDLNRLSVPDQLVRAAENSKIEIDIFPETDVGLLEPDDLPFEDGKLANVMVMLEVAEHMHPGILHRAMRSLRNLLEPKGGRMFFSTPCYNGSAAANHINELGYDTVRTMLPFFGFRIVSQWGTFANQNEAIPALIKIPAFGPQVGKFIEELRAYYDSNVISNIIAPLVPFASRNVLWLVEVDPDYDPEDVALITDLTRDLQEHTYVTGDTPSQWPNQHPEIECLVSGELPAGAHT